MLARAISQRKRDLILIWILAFLGALLLSSVPVNSFSPSFRAYAFTQSTYSPSQNRSINLNLTFGQTLRVIAPGSSNVTILSLSGGQYDTGLYESGTKNVVLFTPAEIANYSLALNISSTGANSAGLSELGTPASTWTKNITGTGNLLLNLSVVVLPQPVSQASGWNPLFGFTGISLGGVTLGATDILAMFAILSGALIVIGIRRSHKLLYAGMFILSLLGMIVVGILVVGIVIGSYLAGFVIIKSYFGFKSRRQNGI